MKLSDLLAALPSAYTLLSETQATPDSSFQQISAIEISDITADSRQVGPGSLFVAYGGVNVDGHQFIASAIAHDVAAIVCEKAPTQLINHLPIILVPDGREALAYFSAVWEGYPARQLTMVGITGTDGKTTTTHYLYHMLQAAEKDVGMINTVGAVIGSEVLTTGLHTTTPDSPDVQRYLAQMVKSQTDICLLEVTSHGLTHHRVTGCDFDIAIVTNITHEHLDLHGSLDNYRAAKASLFESLASAADKGQQKIAILNCDDWSFEYLKRRLEPLGIAWLGYSQNDHPEATVTAHQITYYPDKTSFAVESGAYSFPVETTLLGDYNVSNCLAAATAALNVLEIPVSQIQAGVTALPGISGRMERLDEGQPFIAIVDFAHTPNALRRALASAQMLTAGRVIAIFGCAGLRDLEKRVSMGEIAAELADFTIITAEDPRTESLDAIIDTTAQAMMAQGSIEGQTFERVPDRGRALYRAVQLANPDDVVITLGKGHEQSMCFGEIEYPWDDAVALRTALGGAPLLTLPTAN
ncbi:MAG: UDP-N-acetylmuramoyl-L-alanyl-D-glutamate--2,6-diaminopimelate ligase [Chloroflexota bacterium]